MPVTTTGTVTKLKLNDFRGFVEMQPDGETGIALSSSGSATKRAVPPRSIPAN